jgi:hypothetical protein
VVTVSSVQVLTVIGIDNKHKSEKIISLDNIINMKGTSLENDGNLPEILKRLN